MAHLPEDGLDEEQCRAERTNNHPPRTKHTRTEIFFQSINLVLLNYRLLTSCPFTSGCGQLPTIVCINFLFKKCHLTHTKILPSLSCRLWFLKVLEVAFTPLRTPPAIYSFNTQCQLRLNVVKRWTIISCVFYTHSNLLCPRIGNLEKT